jgi:hypothetical protein
MRSETISQRDRVLIRRLVLEPGEAGFWHIDCCHRFSVVVTGSRLTIEFRDTAETVSIDVHPGLAEWDAPEPRIHRAVNRGSSVYEEVVIFALQAADQEPQPRQE